MFGSRFCFFLMVRRPQRPPLFPYTTLFRSWHFGAPSQQRHVRAQLEGDCRCGVRHDPLPAGAASGSATKRRSEEHTSELQSRQYLVCRLLLEKKTITSLRPLTIFTTLLTLS